MEKRILYSSKLDFDIIKENLEDLQKEELKEEYNRKAGELRSKLAFIGDSEKIENTVKVVLGTENSYIDDNLCVDNDDVWEEYESEYNTMQDEFLLYLEDNKNIGELLVFGTQGTWQGNKRIVSTLGSIERILSINHDDAEIYIKDGDLMASFSHHDGTHYFTYRKFKEGIKAEEKKKALMEYIEDGKTKWLDLITVKLGGKF